MPNCQTCGTWIGVEEDRVCVLCEIEDLRSQVTQAALFEKNARIAELEAALHDALQDYRGSSVGEVKRPSYHWSRRAEGLLLHRTVLAEV